MQFQGALINEQNVTFAIVIVKEHVLSNSHEAEKIQNAFGTVFGGVPVVLMAQDHKGIPTYYGRPDIVKFLANVIMEAIPWKEYTIS